MTPEHFCFWLQGYCDIHGTPPTQEQWASIVAKLKTVNALSPSIPPMLTEHQNGWPVTPMLPACKRTGVYGTAVGGPDAAS